MLPYTRSAAALGLAIAFAVAAGVVDFHADEPQPAVLLLLLGGALASWLSPSAALPILLILGAAIPVTYLVANVAGWRPATPVGIAGTFLALIPATISVAAGLLISRLTERPL